MIQPVPPHWRELLGLLPGYDPFRACGEAWFDAPRAEAAIAFIEECIKHVEGAMRGQPFLLQPWQKAFVANLFGWVKKDKRGRVVRRYREALLYVPRKNGKTPLAAAIALCVFFTDGESGQQDYVAAADREQAGMLFRQAKGMIDQEEELARRCRMYGGNASAGQSKSIVREEDGSFLRVVSADADTKHGGTSHLVMIDELHAQPNRDLVDVLATSMASENRAQPLLLYLTTADYARPSICNEVHTRACAVRDGILDAPDFLPCIYETRAEEDWRDPAVWAKANPNLGVSVSEDYLKTACAKAQDNPAFEMVFRRLHLNQITQTDARAIDMAKWDQAPEFDDWGDLEGKECFGGLDLSTTTDLSAFVLAFRHGDKVVLRPYFWAPREKARERSRKDRVDYEGWAAQGFVKLTDGPVIDYDVIRADINALREVCNIKEIASDRWNATQILTQLAGDGFEIVAYGQGFRDMTAPTKELLALVTSQRLVHHDNPVLRWMASVFAVETDAAGNLKPTKKKSTDRIDGIVALIMGLGRMLHDDGMGSVYDKHGLETF